MAGTLLVDTTARDKMSVFEKLVPTGAYGKPLSGVFRALASHAGLTVVCQAGMTPLAWPTVLTHLVQK